MVIEEIFQQIAKLSRVEDKGYPEPIEHNTDLEIKVTVKLGQISIRRSGRAKIRTVRGNKFFDVLISIFPFWTSVGLYWLIDFKKLDLNIHYSDQLEALLESSSFSLEDLVFASECDLDGGFFQNIIQDFCLSESQACDLNDPISLNRH